PPPDGGAMSWDSCAGAEQSARQLVVPRRVPRRDGDERRQSSLPPSSISGLQPLLELRRLPEELGQPRCEAYREVRARTLTRCDRFRILDSIRTRAGAQTCRPAQRAEIAPQVEPSLHRWLVEK